MALTSTVYQFEIDLSDVDRGVYETLKLRLARHPSETLHYMLTRTIAYCFSYQDGVAFGGGVSTTDEPAVWVRDRSGDVVLWLDVGSPSAERLHKASKVSRSVVVFTHHDPRGLLEQLRDRKIHRKGELEIFALAPSFLEDVVPEIERKVGFSLVRSGGELYLTIAGKTFTTRLERHTLCD